MERPLIAGPRVELPEPPPRRRGGGLFKGAAFILLFAALVAGAGYFFGGGALLSAATPEQQRAAATELAKILTSQVSLYMLQHNDVVPDFGRYPNWEQLTKTTDRAGKFAEDGAAKRPFGPYMKSVPTNPANGMSTVAAVKGPVRPRAPVPGGRKVGWVFETIRARVHATDDSGTRVIDSGGRRAGR